MTQVKFTIESDIVDTFKTRCATEGVSMASVIRRWMKSCHPAKEPKAHMLTRPQRRKAVLDIIVLLNNIMESEADYCDGIPEQFTQRREAADHACSQLQEAISSLEDAF